MKKLTPTHHRNYFEVEHKTTRRCNPFAYRHHNVLFPNPYAYQHNKVIYLFRLKIGSTTKEGKQSRTCISLDNTVADPANINKCSLHLSTFFHTISGPFQSFQTYIYMYQCWPKTITARDQKKLWSWTRVVQTKVHFFSFLEVNIRLRIAQDNICFFQVLRQLYSALVPLSAPYNCLHSVCLVYKVDRANNCFCTSMSVPLTCWCWQKSIKVDSNG